MSTAAPRPKNNRTATHLSPVPPSSVSVDGSGELKDTPANRALHPKVVAQQTFKSKKLTDGAAYADDKSILLCGDVKEQLQKLIDAKLKVDCIVTSPPVLRAARLRRRRPDWPRRASVDFHRGAGRGVQAVPGGAQRHGLALDQHR